MELSVSSHRLFNSSCSSSSSSSSLLFNSRITKVPLVSLINHHQHKLQLFNRLHHKLNTTTTASMETQSAIPHASHNGSSITGRIGEVKRVTNETNVHVKINLDGTGVAENNTGIPFLDHMLDQLASHGLFDVHVKATGDIHIDDHHTNEDVALAIGTALLQALGDRKGINRFGDFSAPLDEALIHVALDLSGRPHLNYDLQIPTQRVGTYDTQLVEHFFQSLANTSGMTLHIRQLAGKNSHHIIEATFKAFARALRQATEYDLRRGGSIPSSKGVLSRS
ncbi:Imidazoleglycerol-phosphate dehydratase [Capsicum baccatum]|uniref:Imidazoleglycerol-phosphate dehydratase n=1 Tax=Capsicum baccatum TaxID=33114 RepID=A0A2G2W0E6_CAPBA|nr:Imidazoleglycerol-phosphate dehydratase [Capsicum baccatum]